MSFWKFVLIVFLAVVLLFVTAFVYSEYIHKEMICQEESPDGRYVFYMYQIGSPVFPFGPVTTTITVENAKGKVIDKYTFELNNDGGSVSEYNLEGVRWFEDRVEADIKGADDENSTVYELKLK